MGQGTREAMADLGTREAMADQGTRAAMTAPETLWAMVGSPPPNIFLGRSQSKGHLESADTWKVQTLGAALVGAGEERALPARTLGGAAEERALKAQTLGGALEARTPGGALGRLY